LLLILPDILNDYAGKDGAHNILNDYASKYGEHHCEFPLQPNEYKKFHCVLRRISTHLTFLKESCSPGLARWFAIKLHNSNNFGQYISTLQQ